MNWLLIPITDQSSAPAVAHSRGGRRRRRPLDTPVTRKAARFPGWLRPLVVFVLFGLATVCATVSAHAQDERRTRVPVLGKIAGGATRQAFSGRVQSVDLKRNLLKVDTVEGGATEIFPVKKSVPVSMADGKKIKLKELTPSTNVIVYYEQKEDRRTVTEIVVLAASGGEEKKQKSPPPS